MKEEDESDSLYHGRDDPCVCVQLLRIEMGNDFVDQLPLLLNIVLSLLLDEAVRILILNLAHH